MSPTGKIDIRANDLLTVSEIEARDSNIRALAEQNRRDIERVMHCLFGDGNGNASLEKTILAEVDKRMSHLKANYQQADVVLGIRIDVTDREINKRIDDQESEHKEQHKENQTVMKANGDKLDKIMMLGGSFTLAAAIIKVLEWAHIITVGVVK